MTTKSQAQNEMRLIQDGFDRYAIQTPLQCRECLQQEEHE